MDFSFVAQGAAPRARAEQSAPQGAPNPAAGQPRPLFQIPTHNEVHAAGSSNGAPNLFQPRGLQQAPQQAQPYAQHGPGPNAGQPSPSPYGNHAGTSYGTPSYTPRPPPVNNAVPPAAANFNPNAIIASKRQQGNPLLRHIRNVRWQFGDVTPDYVLGQNTCALFISLRYHLLHPDYIMRRIKEQLRAWALIVVLCHIDVEDAVKPLGEVSKAAVLNGCTLVCAWSPEECARYLETFKSYESKPASGIQERIEPDYLSRLSAALTSIRGINRTDTQTLGTSRGTLVDILRSTPEQLSACPGIGPTKVQRLTDTFNQPFRKEIGIGAWQSSTAPTTASVRPMPSVPGQATSAALPTQQTSPQSPPQKAAADVANSMQDDPQQASKDVMMTESVAPSADDIEADSADADDADDVGEFYDDELMQQATQMLTQVGDMGGVDGEDADAEEI